LSEDSYNLELLNLHCSNCGALFGSLVFNREVKVTIGTDEIAQIFRTNTIKGLCVPCQTKVIKERSGEREFHTY